MQLNPNYVLIFIVSPDHPPLLCLIWFVFVCVCRQMQGKRLNLLSLKELQHLEKQLNFSLISVRERKVKTSNISLPHFFSHKTYLHFSEYKFM